MISHVWDEMFSWPYGIVVGNLIASGITTGAAVLHQHFRFKRLKAHIEKRLADG